MLSSLVVPAFQEDMSRNIHIKRFQDIPIADMEMMFPDKKVFLKPLLLVQLLITVVIGIISVFVTILSVRFQPAACISSFLFCVCLPSKFFAFKGLCLPPCHWSILLPLKSLPSKVVSFHLFTGAFFFPWTQCLQRLCLSTLSLEDSRKPPELCL